MPLPPELRILAMAIWSVSRRNDKNCMIDDTFFGDWPWVVDLWKVLDHLIDSLSCMDSDWTQRAGKLQYAGEKLGQFLKSCPVLGTRPGPIVPKAISKSVFITLPGLHVALALEWSAAE